MRHIEARSEEQGSKTYSTSVCRWLRVNLLLDTALV